MLKGHRSTTASASVWVGCHAVQEGGPRLWFSTFLLLVHIFKPHKFCFILFWIRKTLDGGFIRPELRRIAALIEHRDLERILCHRDPLSRVPVGWRGRKLNVFSHDGREPSHRSGVFFPFSSGGKRDVAGEIYYLLCLRIVNRRGGFLFANSHWLQDDGNNAVSFSEAQENFRRFGASRR